VTFSDDENSVELPIDDDDDDNDDVLNTLKKSEPKNASSLVKQPTVPKVQPTKGAESKPEEKGESGFCSVERLAFLYTNFFS